MEYEIDLYDVFKLLKKSLSNILLTIVLFALIAAAYSFVLLPNEYTSEVSMYILMREEGSTQGPTYSDINASQMLVGDISDLVFTDRVQSETARMVNLDNLDDYSIEIDSQNSSRVLTMSVTGEDPKTASKIANTLVDKISVVANEVMDIDSINIIDKAQPPEYPSSPNRPKNIVLGAILGMITSSSYVVLHSILNHRISSLNRVEDCVDLRIIANIPTSEF